jgi:hypothetical protein
VLRPGKGKVGSAQRFIVALAGGAAEKSITFNHQVLSVTL